MGNVYLSHVKYLYLFPWWGLQIKKDNVYAYNVWKLDAVLEPEYKETGTRLQLMINTSHLRIIYSLAEIPR